MIKVISIMLIFFSIFSRQTLDMSKFKGMKARSIGPATMSGRVTSIAVLHNNTKIMYVGTASGGLWKTESSGLEWTPIFDDEKVGSIGSVTIDQNNPDLIWVGTGEGNPRNSVSSGQGIYKSIDAGRNWFPIHNEDLLNISLKITSLKIDPHRKGDIYLTTQGNGIVVGKSNDE